MNTQEKLELILEELERDSILVDYIYSIIGDYATYQKGPLNETN